ncbi:MAG: hypothetical protein PF542_04890, partial [Nanoarchaeota archaeon]|nr:hypothetical protein [Nanoarchaeota archaeon]
TNMFKKIINKLNDYSETFMLIVIYGFSILLNWIIFSFSMKLNLFPQKSINSLIAFCIISIFLILSLQFIIKTILWVNLKPKISTNNFNKLIKKKNNKLLLKENCINFSTWTEFFLFSITILGTEYLPFFETIKTAIINHPLKLNKNFKKEKISGYYIGKSLKKKQTIVHTGYLTKPLNKNKN